MTFNPDNPREHYPGNGGPASAPAIAPVRWRKASAYALESDCRRWRIAKCGTASGTVYAVWHRPESWREWYLAAMHASPDKAREWVADQA